MEATLNQEILYTALRLGTGITLHFSCCQKTVFRNTWVPELGDVKLQL